MNIPETPADPKKELVLIERSEAEKEANQKVFQLDNVIDFANLPKNAVISLKIGGSLAHKMQMHRAFIRFVETKREIFKEKNFTILFLEPGDSLEILTEQDMEKAGWVKKEQTLIVKPF